MRNNIVLPRIAAGFTALALLAATNSAQAATATTTFNVTLTITSQCTVSGATPLAFGTVGLLSAAINATNSFAVTCTNTTPYTVGLDNGANVLTAQRRMKGGPGNNEFVNYNLFQDAAHTLAWGNSAPTWQSGTGTGSATTFTVFGQVPVQATPSPATNYLDTVTVTVTF